MTEFLGELLTTLKALSGAGITILVLWIIHYISKVGVQKRKNEIKEIDLTNTKINMDTQTKPLDQLVADANKSHGSDEVVKDPGNDDKKGK